MKKGSKSSPLRVRKVLIELGSDTIYAEILLSGHISSGSEAMEVATALQIDPPTLVVQQAEKKAVLPGQAGTQAPDPGTVQEAGDAPLGSSGNLPFSLLGPNADQALDLKRIPDAKELHKRVRKTQGKET